MELRQVRYFVKVAEAGSISKAAAAMGTVQSGISHQVVQLESELGARLLKRTRQGVELTGAGLAFLEEAQLILRHVDQSQMIVQRARLSGVVSVGLAGISARLLGVPLLRKMRERFPDVRLHIVEADSGQLETLLRNRTLDVAVVFNIFRNDSRLRIQGLLREKLLLIGLEKFVPASGKIDLRSLAEIPLVLPSPGTGMRTLVNAAFAQCGLLPTIAAEIDSLSILMQSVAAGFAAAIQPKSAALALGHSNHSLQHARVTDFNVYYVSSMCTVEEEELSPAALATVSALKDCVRELVGSEILTDGELITDPSATLA